MAFKLFKLVCTGPLIILLFFEVNAESADTSMKYNFTVAGLFPLHKGAECKEEHTDAKVTSEAVRRYLEKVSANGDLPFRLGFVENDTCGPPGRAAQIVVDLISQHKDCPSETGQLIGIISMLSNEDTLSLTSVTSSLPVNKQVLHISISATSTELSNRSKYPNFFRVFPDDSKLLTAIIELLKELGWNRIGVIHENTPQWGILVSKLKKHADKDATVCIPKIAEINTTLDGDVYNRQISDALEDILSFEPVIKGVVYIGSEAVARRVLERSSKNGVADLPAFILTGKINSKPDVFDTVGIHDLFTKTKGLFIVSPAFTEINVQSSAQDARPEILNQLSLHTIYGIIAAHAVAKIAVESYKGHCDWSVSACSAIAPEGMVHTMSTVTFDFSQDFGVNIEPITSKGIKAMFNNSADLIQLSEYGIYTVYTFRKESVEELNFTKIGFLGNDDRVILERSWFDDYDKGEGEQTFHDLQKGQCPDKEKCTECLPKDNQERIIHIPGDIYVIGIAPVFNKKTDELSGCGDIYVEGYEMALAIQYGLELFNDSSKFGNKKIGMVILNSCTNDLVIARKILNLHKNGINDGDGQSVDINTKILGYVGGFTSDVSRHVADILKQINLVQISYASTTSLLADKEKYPHFLRVVPSDRRQVKAILGTLKKLKIEYVQVLYAEKEYGETAFSILEEEAPNYNICIVQSIKVIQDENYNKYYADIRTEPYANVIILFLNHQFLVPLLQRLNEKMGLREYHFIASDGWGRHKDLLDYGIVDGVITVGIKMEEIVGLKRYIQNRTSEAYHRHDDEVWLEEYLRKLHNCYFDLSFDKSYESPCKIQGKPFDEIDFPRDDWGNFATLSALALLKGSANFYKKECPVDTVGLCKAFTQNIEGLVQEIINLKLPYGTAGKTDTRLFDDNGDGKTGYNIYQIQKNASNGNKLDYVKVAEYNSDEEFQLDINLLKIIPESSCQNKQRCQQCGAQQGNSDATQAQQKNSASGTYSETLVIGLAIGIGALGLLFAVILIIILRNTKKSGRETPGTEYITPTEIHCLSNSAADSYHDILLQERETRY